MPNCHNPDDLSFDSIKKSVRLDYDFSIREIRKFRHNSPGLREFLKPAQDRLCSVAKAKGRSRVIPANMSQSGKKLDSCGSCELRLPRLLFRKQGIGVCKDGGQIASLTAFNFLLSFGQEMEEILDPARSVRRPRG